MAHNSNNEENAFATWTADLSSPIHKHLTLKQTLNFRNANEQIHRMATFVPDEVLSTTDLSEKRARSFQAVLMFLNISGFSMLFKRYIHDKNGGSLALTRTLNDYFDIVVREVYCNDGDILKFSAEGLLVVWKVRGSEFIFDIVKNVIACAMNIQDSVAALENFNNTYKVNVAIAAGDVTFSVIGSDGARYFVIFGLPIKELKRAKKISLPNDLILSLSAWQHCIPAQYEYVIKDLYNVKIIKVLKQSDEKATYATPSNNDHINSNEISADKKEWSVTTDAYRPFLPYRLYLISLNGKYSETEIAIKKEKALAAISAITTTNPNFGAQLKSYLIKPVIEQIEKNELLRFMGEIRRITVISIDIIPTKYTDNELISLVDKCFSLLHSIVSQYDGCINTVDLFEKNIFFCIVFGVCEYNVEDQFKIDETCKNGIICARDILRTLKTIDEIQCSFVGVATGIAYCGMIGHIARRNYAIIGPPVDKSMKIMDISCDKVSCDYDTVLRCHFKKDEFLSRGVRTLQQEKYHIYEYLGDKQKKKNSNSFLSLDYYYPILGRLPELELFDDILDEIGVANRKYSGLLLEGIDRSGKSRILDAFVTSVYNRRLRPIKLSLHSRYVEKTYSVIYHIILQILEADDYETVEEREKELLNKLGDILALEDFCYLNILMRVRFPLSNAYCSDTDLRRHVKTIDIFEMILKQLKVQLCILLDDIQYMDYRSWEFLSSAINNYNVAIVMTMPKPNFWEDLSHVETEIYKDKRLMKHTLLGLNVDLFPVFACQFLNVVGIPRELSRSLQYRKDGHIGWCEAYLTSILQVNGLDFIKISPNEAAQHDLVFPNGVLVTKLPIGLTPEELAPPLSWTQMSFLNVCVTNENYFKITGKNIKNNNMTELMSEIYDRMNPYEQDFIKCAATLGKVFKRSMLENVMMTSIPLHTTETIFKMIRIRILECASLQRRAFHAEDLIFCIDKKRQTFSDMHHLLFCNCYHSRAVISRQLLPAYAYCKMLEFRVSSFYKLMYNLQTNEEKQEHHIKAANIYSLDARKCNSCGNGRFLRIFTKDMLQIEKENSLHITEPRFSLMRRRTIIESRWATSKPYVPTTPAPRRVSTYRVSIMPTIVDTIDDEEDEIKDEERMNESLRFRRQSTYIPSEITKDPTQPCYLRKFNHIDYRDCQCVNIITHLFWKLHQHIEKSGETDKLLTFLIEYSAGIIQIAQPFYAIKLLSIAIERVATAKVDEWNEDSTNEGIIYSLMGDAHLALGNYDQAKKYYLSAVKLQDTPSRLRKIICYNIMTKIFCKLPDSPRYTVDEDSRRLIVRRFELASYFRRLCILHMVENKLTMARWFALRSSKLAFQTVNNFLEKGEIYLATMRVLYCTENIKLIQHIDQLMLTTIKKKVNWDDVEDIAMVANIYLMMYQIRVLRGKLEEAIDMGIKVWKISKTLYYNKLMLNILPSLIQITLWTSHINKAVDLMRELYFLADDDIDLSAKTWYYALSLDFILDAGIVLESYETSYNYYKQFIVYSSKFSIWRDPQSMYRLMTNLWIYQLRMGRTVTNTYSAEKYIKDITWHDFSQILTCSKGLECYLLILLRCIDTRSSAELLDLIEDISNIIKCLQNISKRAIVIKPRLYLLMAYLYILRGRKSSMRFYLYKAQKFATLQENQLMKAWIMQNRKIWKKKIYDDVAQYWLEYVESSDIVAWQYICNYNVDTWSTILYPLSMPDRHL